ncbi:MAG TPA: HEAT repeat domain-containing protein, partial [Geobacteraceae bacterium]|nr:HEAT repeat domain-containing protein [Geobacteraceae bacterium]
MNQNLSADVPEAIVNSLSSTEEELRRNAVVALGSFSLGKSSSYLMRAMGDDSWRVRKEAVEVFLSSAGVEQYVGALFDLLRSQDNAGLRNSAAEALARLGTSALPVLDAHAHDTDRDVRKFVVDILGVIADPSSMQFLVSALTDDDPNVATAAAENLGNIGRAEAVPALLDALSREDITFRYTVLETLAKIGEPVPFELISRFLSDALLKKAVYECLGSVGGADAAPILVKGLAESGRSVREA